MWQAHHGRIPDGWVVRHDCDHSWCARPGCLRLGEQVDNLGDALRRDRLTHPGRTGKGDRRGAAESARAVRSAVVAALTSGVRDPVELGRAVSAALAAGDPYSDQGRLF
ncbi:HNH endonuclease [Streptomyces sp. NPDC059193]|uniref:HNH endonuclease n=1 Tax=Streptomyces sp. NPDC059193 TaxID=3346763 RepID=UPI0036C114D3